jgi:hypothetical protein
MTDPDLFSVLDRASQGIEPPTAPQHAAAAALSAPTRSGPVDAG